jgi:hypothetical protein
MVDLSRKSSKQRLGIVEDEKMKASRSAGSGSGARVGPTRIRVTSGSHAKASASVSKGRFTIGSSLQADVYVSDRDVEPVHVAVTVRSGLFGSVARIEAFGDGVKVGLETVASGQSIEASFPVRLRFGEAGFLLERPGVVASGLGALPFVLLLAGGLGLLASFALTGATPEMAGRGTGQEQTVEMPARGADIEQRVVGVKKRLADAGLEGKISLSRHRDEVVARGTLSGADHARWRAISEDLRREAGGAKLLDLVSVSSTVGTAPNLVGTVVREPERVVISSKGERARVGETFMGGWLVEEIKEKSVRLRLGNYVVEIPL